MNARRDLQSDHAFDIRELRERLQEAEETLDAIRNGEVDAVVVGSASGQQVYTLENADRPYRVLIEQMQEGAVTISHDGTVLYCNQRFATLLCAQREALIGASLDAHVTPGDRDAFRRLLARDGSTGHSAELSLLASGVGAVPVNVSMIELELDAQTPRLICCVVTDLTHSRQRSHELAAANSQLASEINERRRAEESLEVALEAAGMGSWDLDLASDIVRRSRRYDQICGQDAPLPTFGLAQLLTQFVADDRPMVAAAFEQARNSGSIEFEKRIRRANDQAVRWVHVRGRTYYRERTPARIAGVVSDVTDRRLVEQQLHQAQKMEAIGQLTGGIAHDFNNLLMVIGGSLDLLESRLQDSRSLRYLGAARHGVERGATLNQQLLAFSRRQDLQVEAVCVDALIKTFGNLLDRAVGETVHVDVRPAAAQWFCRTDPHQLETAILNLAINARDAMPQGGTLTLSTELRTVDAAAATIFGAAAGDYVVTRINDTGTGMAPELLGRVFEPFFTTKDVGKGTGLGLSQVYGFAKQSGGFVTLESELHRGTTVLLYLPYCDAGGASTEVVRRSAGVHGRGVILVVEDDTSVREVACDMLRELGYTVLEASSGSAALDLVRNGTYIDMVFSDVIMPGAVGGIDLVRTLRQSHPRLALLLTSGYTAQQFGTQHDAEDVQLLRKPYTVAALSRAVQNLLQR